MKVVKETGRMEDNPEYQSVERYVLEPGEKSKVIQRGEKEFLVVIAVNGCGTFREVSQDTGWIIPMNGCPRIDFREGKEFVLEVPKEHTKPLTVIIMKMMWATNL